MTDKIPLTLYYGEGEIFRGREGVDMSAFSAFHKPVNRPCDKNI